MGAGEVGRELGDAGGPLLVAALGQHRRARRRAARASGRPPGPRWPCRPTTGGLSRISGKPLCHRQHPDATDRRGGSIRSAWKMMGSPPGERRHRRRGDRARPLLHHRPADPPDRGRYGLGLNDMHQGQVSRGRRRPGTRPGRTARPTRWCAGVGAAASDPTPRRTAVAARAKTPEPVSCQLAGRRRRGRR
jgi:hypothetical protein